MGKARSRRGTKVDHTANRKPNQSKREKRKMSAVAQVGGEGLKNPLPRCGGHELVKGTHNETSRKKAPDTATM